MLEEIGIYTHDETKSLSDIKEQTAKVEKLNEHFEKQNNSKFRNSKKKKKLKI